MKKIGLIGTGNVGRFLLQSLNQEQRIPGFRIEAVYHRSRNRTIDLTSQYQTKVFHDFHQFIAEDYDLVIEAATIEAVRDYAQPILKKGINLLLISVGALADVDFYEACKRLCKDSHASIYLPAGAVGGLDILKAANAMGELETVSLTTRKPPEALVDQSIHEALVLFDGPAKEAIERFPKNINVAIVLSLAGIGVERTRVRIIADPSVKQNTHTIEASGSFGQMKLTVENHSMPSNPKTSYLAALSLLAALKNRRNVIRIGS